MKANQRILRSSLLLGLMLSIGSLTGLRAQCLQYALQAISGQGSNAKIGFECGSGCSKRFYLVQNASSSEKWTQNSSVRNQTSCGTFSDKSYNEVEQVSGSNISYKLGSSSGPCATTVTTNTASTSYYREYGYGANSTSVCQGAGVARWGCEEVWVDGVQVTDPNESCWVTIDTTGYTLVSTTNTSDPCEGTKSKSVYKYEAENYLSTIVHEATTSSGYKSEYTTQMAISKAKACAMEGLNASTFPTEVVSSGNASASMSLASDNSSASYGVSKWRVAITGSDPDEKYKLTLNWVITRKGVVSHDTEEREFSGSDQPVWYYPSDGGEQVDPKESEECSYSYSKVLESISLEALNPTGCNGSRCVIHK